MCADTGKDFIHHTDAGSKAMIDLDGTPMVRRVLNALRSSKVVGKISLAGPEEAEVQRDEQIGDWISGGDGNDFLDAGDGADTIDGGTGTAKTRLLGHLAAQGAQTLDLEAMANHRGSLFGPLDTDQPSQKAFESRLAMGLARLDPSRPVFVEAESSRIGRLIIPPSLWKAMIGAPNLRLTAPLAARADHLLTAYPDMIRDPDRLDDTLQKLTRYHGHDQVSAWRALAQAGDFRNLAAGLIATHYDPRYARISRAHAPDARVLDLPDLSDSTLAATAARIIASH